jgi:hypothetical protein
MLPHFLTGHSNRYTSRINFMKYKQDEIMNALRDALFEMELDPEKIDGAIFHMVDWLADLESWNKFCDNPKSFTAEEAGSMIINFLVHVPVHLAAASKLVTDSPVTDVFGIGATSEEKT